MPPATAITPSRPFLTTNDSAVLQALFDAESTPSATAAAITIDSSLPPLPDIPPSDLEGLQAREAAAIWAVQEKTETTTPPGSATSTGGLTARARSGSEESHAAVETAIAELDALIAEHPTYPSAYVNRAQAHRLQLQLDDNASHSTGKGNTLRPDTTSGDESKEEGGGKRHHQPAAVAELIFADLNKAIDLAQPSSPSPSSLLASSATATASSTNHSISPFRARILADAHTHRGYLLLQASKTNNPSSIRPSSLQSLGDDLLEEMASHDFFAAGQYGSPVAKVLAVQTNPYARMCGAIVREALRKEIEGEGV
jgi:hypothetical protein